MRLRSIIVFQHNYMPSYSFHFSAFMSMTLVIWHCKTNVW